MTTTAETAGATRTEVESPFVGLIPYREADAEYFFGREREIELIADNLLASRLTLLYGPSGVGKSSVLYAGVLPHLRRLAVEEAVDGTPEFEVVVLASWRDDALGALEQAIAAHVGEPEATPDGQTLRDRLTWWTERLDRDLLVLLDQFEEYAMYHPDEDGPGTLAGELPGAVNDIDSRVNFLISIRDDALATLDRFKGRIPTLFDNYLRIEHLGLQAGRTAVAGPIERYNQKTPEEVSIEPQLVERVLHEVRVDQIVGSGPDGVIDLEDPRVDVAIETSQLQLVMTHIWEFEKAAGSNVLRLSSLEELGGAAHIVSSHLDEAMTKLSEEQRHLASAIFAHLVTPSGTKIAHSVSDLAAWADAEQAKVEAVLERLSAGDLRILRPVPPPPDRPDEARYEIFHDVLAGAVGAWRTEHEHGHELEETKRAWQAERRASRRRVMWRVLIGVGALVVAFVIVLSWLLWREAREESDLRAAETARAEQEATRAAQEAAISESRELASAAMAALNVNPAESLQMALDALDVAETAEAEAALRAAITLTHIEAVMSGHTDVVTSVAFSPDGSLVATASRDNTARLWDATTGEQVRVLEGHSDWVNSIEFSPDGDRLLTGGGDKTARVWDVATGEQITELSGHTEGLFGARFNHDGSRVVTASWDNTARIWDAASEEELQLLPHDNWVNYAEFSPRGGEVVTASTDALAIVWDSETGDELAWLGHFDGVAMARFDPAGRTVSTATFDGFGAIWEWRTSSGTMTDLFDQGATPEFTFGEDELAQVWVEAGNTVTLTASGKTVSAWEVDADFGFAGETRLRGHDDLLWGVVLSDDEQLALSWGADATARVWDMESATELVVLRGHSDTVTLGEFSPDGTRVVTAGFDGTARVWRVPQATVLQGHEDWVLTAKYSADGSTIVTGSSDGTVRAWDPAAAIQMLEIDSDMDIVTDVAISADNAFIAGAGLDQSVRIWDAAGKPLAEHRFGWVPSRVDFAPDGSTVAIGLVDGSVRLWTWGDPGAPLPTLRGHIRGTALDFSPEGTLLASGGTAGDVVIWDVASGETVHRLSAHNGTVNDVAFSRDGTLLVTAGGDATARIYDTATGAEVQALTGHQGRLAAAAFSPDGTKVVTVGADRLTGVWDVATGRFLAMLSHHGDFVNDVTFDPTGDLIMSASDDHTIRIYSCDSCGDLASVVASATGRLEHYREGAPVAQRTERTIYGSELLPGDCLNAPDAMHPGEPVDVVPCSTPHDAEVVGVVQHPGPSFGSYPTDVDAVAEEACAAAFATWIGVSAESSSYELGDPFIPSVDDWSAGERRIICWARDLAGQMTGSMRP